VKTTKSTVGSGSGTINGSLYDWPKYYDIVYGSDWRAESDFINNCLREFGPARKSKSRGWNLFEPACGTGRLLVRLARQGHSVSGLDLNPAAVNFCNERLRKAGFRPSAIVGDMSRFRLSTPCDAAFNTISSFRHLSTDALALAHLKCMADALRTGGFYLLGLHLTPTDTRPDDSEHWSVRRGHLQANIRMRLRERDMARRLERFAIQLDVYTPTKQFRLQDELKFRSWTARQFRGLLGKVPTLEVAGTFDFAYDLESPIEVDGSTQDVLFVLRKKPKAR
jgi:SAM-dependent methyltransferase